MKSSTNQYTHFYKLADSYVLIFGYSPALGEQPSTFYAVFDLKAVGDAHVAIGVTGTSEMAVRHIHRALFRRYGTGAGWSA